jgi:hypothetical protein
VNFLRRVFDKEEVTPIIAKRLSVRLNGFTRTHLRARGVSIDQAFSSKEWKPIYEKMKTSKHLILIPHRFSDDIKQDPFGSALGVSYDDDKIVANNGKMHFAHGAILFYLLEKAD